MSVGKLRCVSHMRNPGLGINHCVEYIDHARGGGRRQEVTTVVDVWRVRSGTGVSRTGT